MLRPLPHVEVRLKNRPELRNDWDKSILASLPHPDCQNTPLQVNITEFGLPKFGVADSREDEGGDDGISPDTLKSRPKPHIPGVSEEFFSFAQRKALRDPLRYTREADPLEWILGQNATLHQPLRE